jgi:CheY-like chemotaxis protein
MPRLLLVDDNPSIHKIAETLLATSSIQLVCVDSAAAALEQVNQGVHFDVALVDISMAGMDGWGLLAKLRENSATARMPIAMMAGVLDTVDPERIKDAPIQGFLKKPVELRELGDRITKLMETPVSVPEPPPLPPPPPKVVSPFATMPAVRIEDLPEFRKREEKEEKAEKEEPAAMAEPAPVPPEPLDDLLELTEEDLFPEPVAAAPAEVHEEESLDLEELDLDSLRTLSPVHEAAEEPAVEAAAPLALEPLEALEEPVAPTPAPLPGFTALDELAEPTPQSTVFPDEQLDAIATLDRLPETAPVPVEEPITELDIAEVELPDLGSPHEEVLDASTLSDLPEIEELATSEQIPLGEIHFGELIEEPREELVFTPPLPPLEESLDWSDESESMLAAVEAPAPQMETVERAVPLPEEELDLLDVSVPEPSVEAPTMQLDLQEAAPAPVFEPEPVAVPEPPVVPEPPALDIPPAAVSAEAIVESALQESAAAPPEALPAEPAAELPASNLNSRELLDSMMADPALMDALAKAVVARLGDQILREIAWEVIPGLAERYPRS